MSAAQPLDVDALECCRPPKAVIFDFDGVILESADIKTQAFLELFADYPEHREAILRHHLDNIGVSRYRKFEWIYAELLRRPLDEAESRRLGRAFSDIALGKILACPCVSGAVACLESLKGKTMLFVASGTPQEELDLIVERRELAHYFTEVWGTPKSKEEIIGSILSRFSLDVVEVLFIGDGKSDFEAARQTGIMFVARENGTRDVDWRGLGIEPIHDLLAVPELLGIDPTVRAGS